jgi:predicted dehydrogenase
VSLRVGIVGCGLIGRKRAAALGEDRLVACHDRVPERAEALAADVGALAAPSLDALLDADPDVVIVAATHDALADVACHALAAGAHVLVEKPAGRTPAEVERIADAAERADRLVKVGFNHRFHPGIAGAIEEAASGRHGPVMFLRARYGHGGRLGYEREWRADPAISGGGELLDQGMHVLDLIHWLLGPLPLHSALLRTSFWPMEVEDNAVVTLADAADPGAPWATLHASWSEWKNEFALEIYCRTAKLAVHGLGGSYGPETFRRYTMRPEMGPPDLEEVVFAAEDGSWAGEWRHFRAAVRGGSGPLLGDLESARWCHAILAAAYAGDARASVAAG